MSKCRESILVYGVSGAGKTTQVQELAKYVHRTEGKVVRLASCSGGGWTSIQPAINTGIVVPTYLRGRKFPIETMHRISLGWWPEHVDDPESPLQPPEKQKDFKDIGGLAVDSITEGCEWMMSYMTNEEAAGSFKISSQPMKFKDGATSFGSPSMAHYGNIQMRIGDFIANSKALPSFFIFWTALELKATDDDTRLPLYGPDIVGKKKTAVASAWFDNTLHLHLTQSGGLKQGEVKRRLHLSTHFEEDGIPYVAKNRGHYYAPLPNYLEDTEKDPGACSVNRFLELLSESHKKAEERLRLELSK